MAQTDFRLRPSANNDRNGHFDDVGAIGKTITPEIVIALCGPMGTPLHDVAKTFKELLQGTDYNYEMVNIIRLSEDIRHHKKLIDEKSICRLIEAGNELRAKHGNEILARFAVRRITLEREKAQAVSEAAQAAELVEDGRQQFRKLPSATATSSTPSSISMSSSCFDQFTETCFKSLACTPRLRCGSRVWKS